MIDKESVRNMSRLAMLEDRESLEVIKTCSFKKIDFCIVQAVKGCVAGTVCFAAALGLWLLYIWDDVNTYFYDAQYMVFLKHVLGIYCIFMFIYLIICVLVALHRHKQCRGKRRRYMKYLRAIRNSYRIRDRYSRRADRSVEGGDCEDLQ
ncbi:MAG: hypothetical protein LUC41_08650 [Clostridiales bacterium]|nr:hypothetical protein [Clostridiales bacterium]